MPIPETLSARRAELERDIGMYERKATACAAQGMDAQQSASVARAELHGITQSIEAYEAAETPPIAAPEKRERRDLRKLVLEYIEYHEMGHNAEIMPTTLDIAGHLDLRPYQPRHILTALRDSGKITGDDNGWRLVRGEGETGAPGEIKWAAE